MFPENFFFSITEVISKDECGAIGYGSIRVASFV